MASARVLSEGIDVPAVDTVVFADPRTSSVDIVQATGRAMRTAPEKARGRIVLTVDLGDDAPGLDDDSRFAASRWRHVWQVLRALASMDPRFKREMQRKSKEASPSRQLSYGSPVKSSRTLIPSASAIASTLSSDKVRCPASISR